MAHRKIKIILNPMADMGNAWRVARDLRSITEQHGGIDWSGTVYPGHAIELAKQSEGYDMVIAMGGDGTVHEVMNGLMQIPAEKRPVLGVVPVGSGNDLAHYIKIPKEPTDALQFAINGEPALMDIGLMIDGDGRREYFDNTLGIGFGATVTIRSHRIPLIRGFLMYLTAVLQAVFLDHNPIKMQMDADGRQWENTNLYLVMCNSPREGGGFSIVPEAKIDDGIFHYAMIDTVSRFRFLSIIVKLFQGTHLQCKEVKTGTCKKFSITADRPLYIHMDGEIFSGPGTNVRQVSMEILPNALNIVRN